MVVTADIAELFEHGGMSAVSVMDGQARFEWASAMLFNCGACLELTPEYIDDEANKLFDFAWAPYMGSLPPEWNHCVGYAEPAEAKLYHYTQGLPCFYETLGLPEDAAWNTERKAMLHSVSWTELMGKSVHAEPVLNRLYKRITA